MDAADLKIFETVARLGTMSGAAAELHTVQSNVTARIRLLEEELKTRLFERHSNGVTLTDAGQRLLPYAVQMRQLVEEARRAVAEDGVPKGSLVIGSLETTAALRLSPLLADYVAAYPEVDLVLRTGTSAELLQDVLARRLEGAFVCGPVDHPELETRLVVREELVLLTAPALTSLDAALHTPDLKLIVLRAGCSYRQRLEDLLARRGIVGPRWLEFGTIEAIVSCVAAGLGVTLLPKALIGAVWREGRVAVHPLPPAEAAVETLFVRRRDGFVSSALAAFLLRAGGAALHSEAAE
jgi:DNA-binding transcriptional LysR family regulator